MGFTENLDDLLYATPRCSKSLDALIVTELDDLYDVYALHAVTGEGINPNFSISTRMLVLHVSGKALEKFKEFA